MKQNSSAMYSLKTPCVQSGGPKFNYKIWKKYMNRWKVCWSTPEILDHDSD